MILNGLKILEDPWIIKYSFMMYPNYQYINMN